MYPRGHRPISVGLLTTLNTNIGDDFIREGLIHVIERLVPGRSVRYTMINKHAPGTVYEPWHPIRWLYSKQLRHRRNTGRLRRWAVRYLPPFGFSRFDECDIVLQCGTPVIWEGCRNSEWAGVIWRGVFARLALRGVPVLNLGGGSCYPIERCPATLLGSPDEEFVRLMLDTMRLTTVRDRLAQQLFGSLGHQTIRSCCPALLTAQVYAKPAAPTRKVLINFMHGGGHFGWGQGIDPSVWERTMHDVIAQLGAQGWQPLMIAHNEKEIGIARRLWPDLPRTLPAGPLEYFETARDAAFGVFNRMHASVSLAGLGIPSVAVGTDSRNLMVENLGLPVLFVKEATSGRIFTAISELLRCREQESRRLLALREATLRDYEGCLRPFFAPFTAGLN
jgi:hypothetical protein